MVSLGGERGRGGIYDRRKRALINNYSGEKQSIAQNTRAAWNVCNFVPKLGIEVDKTMRHPIISCARGSARLLHSCGCLRVCARVRAHVSAWQGGVVLGLFSTCLCRCASARPILLLKEKAAHARRISENRGFLRTGSGWIKGATA